MSLHAPSLDIENIEGNSLFIVQCDKSHWQQFKNFHENNGEFCGKGIDKVGEVCNIMVKSGKKW